MYSTLYQNQFIRIEELQNGFFAVIVESLLILVL